MFSLLNFAACSNLTGRFKPATGIIQKADDAYQTQIDSYVRRRSVVVGGTEKGVIRPPRSHNAENIVAICGLLLVTVAASFLR